MNDNGKLLIGPLHALVKLEARYQEVVDRDAEESAALQSRYAEKYAKLGEEMGAVAAEVAPLLEGGAHFLFHVGDEGGGPPAEHVVYMDVDGNVAVKPLESAYGVRIPAPAPDMVRLSGHEDDVELDSVVAIDSEVS